MRQLKQNEQPFWYAQFNSKIPILDSDGYETGDYETGYSAPVSFSANISAGKGTSQEEVFGKELDFTRTICTTDMTCPINEHSLIWIETEPVLKPDGTADPNSADYTVATLPARSLNSIMIAIKRRQKNGGVQNGK